MPLLGSPPESSPGSSPAGAVASEGVVVHQVRYEIGEHPLADVLQLTGGGSLGVPVIVVALVPGGKAAQAGITPGDELIAVSGRSEFQKLPADRLLDSLPTPTLLVFAKDLKTRQTLAGRGLGLTEPTVTADAQPNLASSLQISQPLKSRQGAGLASGDNRDGAAQGVPPILQKTPSIPAYKFTPAVLPNQKPADHSCKRKSDDKSKSEDPSQTQKPAAPSQLALVHKSEVKVGLPTNASLLGPHVEMEVCEMVTFDAANATLMMQGHSNEAGNRSVKVNGERNYGIIAGGKKVPGKFVYELPRRDAKKLVDTAIRDASRGGILFSALESTVADLDSLDDMPLCSPVNGDSNPQPDLSKPSSSPLKTERVAPAKNAAVEGDPPELLPEPQQEVATSSSGAWTPAGKTWVQAEDYAKVILKEDGAEITEVMHIRLDVLDQLGNVELVI